MTGHRLKHCCSFRICVPTDRATDCLQAAPSILIAEDELLIPDALRRELERELKVVAVPANGIEAVEAVARNRPAVALLEIGDLLRKAQAEGASQ